ncbi:MAG: response regulator transcription factor [Desulfobacterales bacterium]|nr:response regulator transcription factor [Desulfobacterales bacterium]
MNKIKVLIVDDQQLIREGLEMMLSIYDQIQIIGTSTNGKEALDQIELLNPDVVLMDIRMPVMDGVTATQKMKDKYPALKVIILTTFDEDEYIFEALNNGANGYLLKDVKSEEIVRGIEEVYAGNTLLEPKVATKVVQALNSLTKKPELREKDDWLKQLTNRELEIAHLVAEGKNNKEISDMLFITEGTVKNHLTRILSKLEIRDRTQLAILIREKGYD